MTAPGGTFAEANVKATLTWDDIERLMTPRVEAAMKQAEKSVAKHLDKIEAAFGRTADRMAEAFAHGMNQAARTVDRELASIERRLRTSRMSITIDVNVDSAAVERQLASQNMSGLGAAQGRKFSAGFVGALSAGFGAVSRLFAGGLGGAETRFARIALGTKIAAFAAGQLAKKILLVGGALGGLGAGALGKLAVGLKLASKFAGQLARDLGRVIALVTVLKAVGSGLGKLAAFGKIAAIGTIGFSALLGAATGVAQLLGGPLVSALTAVGAAMGVAAGAAVGILGPALVALKVGFKGLSDGAKKFNEQFKEMDDALSERIGNMMAPLLTAWHDASSQMKLAFAGALQPAFKSMGTLVSTLRPQLVGLSTTLGEVGNEVAKSLTGPAAKQGFADMISASNQFFSYFKGESGLGGLSAGLVSFAGTAAKTFAGTGESINDALLSAGEWLRNISPDQMRAAFDQLRQVFDNIAAVVGPVLSGLRQLGAISAPALAPGFKAVGDAISQATPGVLTMARELMPALGQALQNLAPILPGIVNAFTPWASVVAVLAPHIATLLSHLGPLAPVILGIALAAKTITSAMVAYNAIMAIASVGQGVFAAATGASSASLAGNTIALAAHKVATVAGTIATNAASIAMRAFGVALRFATGPIGLIITAVALVGAAIWAFFTKTETGRKLWATIWTGIKTAVSAVVEWFTGTAVPWLKSAWDNIAAGATWLWQNVIQPVWEGIKSAIGVAITIIKGYISGWIAVFKVVGSILTWLWQNVVVPVWDGIKAAIGLAIDFISAEIEGFKAIWAALEPIFLWLWHNVIEPVWNGIRSAIETVVNWITQTAVPWIQKAWKDFTTGLDYIIAVAKEVWEQVKEKFTNMVDFVKGLPDKIKAAASGMWDGLKDGLASALNWAIDKLNSFVSVLNKVPGVNISAIPHVGFAAGGWTGPGSKYQAAGIVHADEFVLSKAARGSIEGKFPGLLDFMNTNGTLPGYAEGGVVGAMTSLVQKRWPGITMTSGYRNSNDHHGQGLAADFSNGSGNTPEQLALAQWIAKNFPNSKELIYSHPGFTGNIDEGKNVGDGVGFFGASTMAGHRNHVHWAMASPPRDPGDGPADESGNGAGGAKVTVSGGGGGGSTGGSGSGGSGSGGSGGGSKRTAQQELARIPLAALESAFGIKIPEWLDPTIQQQTEQATSANTAAVTANTQAIAQQTTATTTSTAQATTGAATVPLVQNADGTWGSSDPEWNKLIKRESGGNAKITQGVSDANSAAGDPATGLFQITGGTWKGAGGTQFAASAKDATPQQQAQIAAKIFQRNNGSDWGVGLAGRENAAALRAGLTSGAAPSSVPFPQTPTVSPTTTGPGMPLPVTQTASPAATATPTLNRTGEQAGPQLVTGDTGTSNNTGGDLVTSGIGWAGDATKEIVGQFLAPFGLDGLFGKGVDIATNGAKGAAAQAQKAAQAGVQAASAAGAATGNPALVAAGAAGSGATAVFNQQFNTTDPKAQTQQMVRAVGGQSLVTNTLRSP